MTTERINSTPLARWSVWCEASEIGPFSKKVRELIPDNAVYNARASWGNRDEESDPEHLTVTDCNAAEIAVLLPIALECGDGGISVDLSEPGVKRTHEGQYEAHAGIGVRYQKQTHHEYLSYRADCGELSERIRRAVKALQGKEET